MPSSGMPPSLISKIFSFKAGPNITLSTYRLCLSQNRRYPSPALRLLALLCHLCLSHISYTGWEGSTDISHPVASAEHSEGSLEYPRYLGRRLGIASKQVPKLVHGVRGQARFAMDTDVTHVLCEPVVKNRDVKGDGAHICGRHGRKSSRLVLFTPWAKLVLPVTLDKPPLAPHPSPYSPTLSIHQSPGRRHHVPRPSQRTSWYSLVPAMEERNIKPCP